MVAGVSKVVTVDVKGDWQRWLKVRDLTKGVTYFFRVQARTIAYGPELQANVTAGPAEGKWSSAEGPVPVPRQWLTACPMQSGARPCCRPSGCGPLRAGRNAEAFWQHGCLQKHMLAPASTDGLVKQR